MTEMIIIIFICTNSDIECSVFDATRFQDREYGLE